MPRESGGGAGASGGFEFQHRVAAWIAVRVLAEEAASPPFDMSAAWTAEELHCETQQSIDDVRVVFSSGATADAQVKRSLSLSDKLNSVFSDAVGQFTGQFIALRKSLPAGQAIDPQFRRFVLVVSPAAPATLRVDLRSLLQILMTTPPSRPLSESPRNAGERKALAVVTKLIRHHWNVATGTL